MSSTPPLPDSHTSASAVMLEDAITPASPLETRKALRPAPIWLQRLSLLVQVMFCVYIGILLVIMPWYPHLLETNELISSYPALHDLLSLGAVRGIISGIGFLDIWIGISEVIHYHEVRG